MLSDLGAAGSHAIDRAGMIIRYQQRTIFQDLHVHRPAAVFVILKKSGEKWFLRLYCAILVQLYDNDVAADFLCSVPGAVARDEDRVLILARKHFPRVKPHA